MFIREMFLFTHLLSVFAQPHKGEETALLALHHREGGRQALEAARDAIYVDSTNPRYKKENTYVCLLGIPIPHLQSSK